MKKLLYILILFALSPVAFADILEGTSTDIDVLMNSNYSESAVKMVDMVKAQNAYGAVPYEQHWKKERPQNPIQHIGHWYHKAKTWFDPMADDGYFGAHEINFDNKFFQMEPDQFIYRKNKEEL